MGFQINGRGAFNRGVTARQLFVKCMQVLMSKSMARHAEGVAFIVSLKTVGANDGVITAAPLGQAVSDWDHRLMLPARKTCNACQHVKLRQRDQWHGARTTTFCSMLDLKDFVAYSLVKEFKRARKPRFADAKSKCKAQLELRCHNLMVATIGSNPTENRFDVEAPTFPTFIFGRSISSFTVGIVEAYRLDQIMFLEMNLEKQPQIAIEVMNTPN